jgi:hypothetical protein
MTIEAEQALFDACLDAGSAEERERLLIACPDASLAARVRRLLLAHEEASTAGTLQPSLGDFPSMPAPHRVGPYRILSRLGEGAMGDVYLAEQESPVRRRVGLKILKFGLSTREIVARFELERDALAMLSHPNIARIFDAGTTSDGRPRALRRSVRGRAACASSRDHSPGPEAVEHPRHRARWTRRAEDHRLRHREGDSHDAG